MDVNSLMIRMFRDIFKKSNNRATNSCINLFCTNWCGIIKLVELNISLAHMIYFCYFVLLFNQWINVLSVCIRVCGFIITFLKIQVLHGI